jgi:hypothetical protein
MSILCDCTQMGHNYYHMHMLGLYLLCCIVDTDLDMLIISAANRRKWSYTRSDHY